MSKDLSHDYKGDDLCAEVTSYIRREKGREILGLVQNCYKEILDSYNDYRRTNGMPLLSLAENNRLLKLIMEDLLREALEHLDSLSK